MRILILTPRLPWPALDGGRVAMSRLAQSLANAGAEVDMLSLNPRKHRGTPRGPLPIRAVDIDTSRLVGPLLRSIFSRLPFIVARFVSREFHDAVDETIRRFRPDLVQIESPFLLPYAPKGVPTVLRSLNVEFRIWEGLANAKRNPLLHWIASSLRRYEIRAMNGVDAIVPISAADATDFRALGCTRPMYVVPCGVVLPTPDSQLPAHGTVGFIGSLDYRPNQDAVTWIVDELWPRVVERVPDAKLSIAGSAPPEWLRTEVERRGIELQANVADPNAFVRSVAVILAPIRAGGGMRIKILEAMALGRPVVATTLGASGTDAQHVIIADEPEPFADAVAQLLHDPEEAARIGAAGREHVAREYESDALAAGLLRFYEEQLAREPAARRS
ncbi:MAG TPA: glycosyltransferase family 4 protein [Thermoanaerobaculia bacterium]|jgi:glycosyltransferase involved in cell wall biosynthesis